MEKNNQEEYIKQVAEVLITKILEMKNVNKESVAKKAISNVALKAAIDLLTLNVSSFDEDGLFDDYTAETLKSNFQVGELQARCNDFLGVNIIISRYTKEDVSDVSIQLIDDDSYGNRIGVIETVDETCYSIKDLKGKVLDYSNEGLKYTDGESKYYFNEAKDISLKKALYLFKSGKIEEVFKNQMIETHK